MIPVQTTIQSPGPDLIVGRNVNMVSGTEWPGGDPYLQRQNEPSIAVSTRNPLHLLAGANDYRTVDMPESEGPLPGIPEGATAGDAWLGVFKSFNGGESWKSTLLPGYPQDNSTQGLNSPIHTRSTASDPTVRAGSNGLFYYSGIAFDRVEGGTGVLFVARFIDNNFTLFGDTDPIKYLDTKIVDTGTPGQFADKPWIAVDAPRYGGDTVPIYAPGTPVQDVARHNVYIVYSIFLGNIGGNNQSKILFARSTDCGTTWERPIKVSEGNLRNQGTTIAISPADGTIYLAWRRFASPSQPDAILMCKSTDFGSTFSPAVEINPINPFDQITAGNRFRTYGFPTIAVDDAGRVYVSWADRGYTPNGASRIVIKASPDGIDWSGPTLLVDDDEGCGHQLMPSLTYAAGRLMITWYDSRKSLGNDPGNCGYDISDNGPSGKRHTIDVRIAQALPSSNPSFIDSTQVSKYFHWVQLVNDEVPPNPQIIQKEYNRPNLPLFVGGTIPFIGDYIDIAAAPAFLYDVPNLNNQTGTWRFNTEESDPSTAHVTWTDNRDVHPPGDGDWTSYNPPNVPTSTTPCSDGTKTGMRNQNIYTSAITRGIMIGSPVNTKPLIDYRRSFLIFVKNLTDFPKYFRLEIMAPNGMQASFWEFGPPQGDDCELEVCNDKEVKLWIEPYSSTTLTVFIEPFTANPYATFKVLVEELEGTVVVFQDYIILNPDPVNTQTVPVLEEYHTPIMEGDFLAVVDLADPTMLSGEIVYDPNLDYILNYANPDIVTPAFRSPAFRSKNIVNPAFRSTTLAEQIPDGQITDLQWKITNNNDTTSAYSFLPIGEVIPLLDEGVDWQLLIYRVSTTPTSPEDPADPDTCELIQEEHHELLYKIDNPAFRSPAFRSPAFRSNTLSLAPGESAVCTLRLISPTSNPFDAEDFATTVAAAAVPQAANPDGAIEFAASLYIIGIEEGLIGSVNDPFTKTLEAYGGEPFDIDYGDPYDPDDDVWKYQYWEVIPKEGESLPPGLTISSDGIISGIPVYDPLASYPQEYNFTVQVKDESTPQQTARRTFKITIHCAFYTITATAGPGGSISPSGDWPVAQGEDASFTIEPADCFHVVDVIVDKDTTWEEHLGPVLSYTFTDVRADHTIHAEFQRDTFTITAIAGEGGSITPSGEVIVDCGLDQTFTIATDEGYMVEDVIVDKGTGWEKHLGPVTTYTFNIVRADHTIEAIFKKLEKWVQRYNNNPADGDDEASDLAVGPSGNVYVTGYSTGKTSGEDFHTIQYHSDGVEGWSARYDGPSHLGDYAHAIVVDALGNPSGTGISYRGNVDKHADYCTVKYNSSGEEVWDEQYDARRNGNDVATSVALDSEGNVYITGRSEYSLDKQSEVLHHDFLTIKYHVDTGKIAWEARYDNTNVENSQDEAAALAVDSEGNTYVTGRSQGSGTGFDLVTVKYDSGGNELWVRRYNNELVNGDDEAVAIALDSLNNIYITGRSEGTSYDYVTIKYLPDGTIDATWGMNGAARFDGGQNDEAVAVAADSKGNTFVTGRSQGSGTGFDFVTIMYDSSGNQSWIHRYNNEQANSDDETLDMALDSDGNVYVTGRSQGSGTGFDYYTIKYDGSGNMVWRVRYNHSNGDDEAKAIIVDSAGNVYVTGRSQGSGTGFDYATIKYEQ